MLIPTVQSGYERCCTSYGRYVVGLYHGHEEEPSTVLRPTAEQHSG